MNLLLRAPRSGALSFILGAGLGLICLTGCGSGGDKPISAVGSKFKAEDEEETSAPSKPEVAKEGGQGKSPPTASSDPAAPGNNSGGKPSRTKPSGDSVAANTSGSAVDPKAKPEDGSGDPAQPPTIAAEKFDLSHVPENATLEELSKFIQKIEQQLNPRSIPGKTPEEKKANALKIVVTRQEAAEKGLALATTAGNEKVRNEMFRALYVSIATRMQLGEEGQEAALLALFAKLRDDKNIDIAVTCRMLEGSRQLEALRQGQPVELPKLMAELQWFTPHVAKNRQALDFLGAAIEGLHAAKHDPEATQLMRAMSDVMAKSGEGENAKQAENLAAEADLWDSHLEQQAQELVKGKAEAAPIVIATVDKLLSGPKKPALFFGQFEELARALEANSQGETAGKLYALLEKAYGTSEDKELAATAARLVPSFKKRGEIVGQVLPLSGNNVAGEPMDAKRIKGHVSLVLFCKLDESVKQALQEAQLYLLAYKKKGLELLLVCLDEPSKATQANLEGFPWTASLPPDAKSAGFAHPMAVAAGVDSIPQILLLDAEGKVLAIQLSGERLRNELSQQFGPIDPSVLGQIGGGGPGRPQRRPPAVAPPNDGSSFTPVVPRDGDEIDALLAGPTFFVAEEGADSKKPAAEAKQPVPPVKKPVVEANPYLADPGLSADELVTFILDMREKPKPIQERPGFVAAVLDAADRLLADPKATPRAQLIALEGRCDTLHERACDGDDEAQKKLMQFVDKFAADSRPEVAKRVRFYQLEARVLAVEKLPVDKVPALLADVRAFCEKETLGEEHLRLASHAVRAVNRLESGDEREKQFVELGKVLSKSSFKRLARYGKALMTPDGEESDLVGKPIELAGTTAKGDAFDWQSYRGKVVVVDFWATWCGPCRAEMPHVRELYDKHHAAGLEVVGVSLDADEEALGKYIEENGIPWPTLAGEKNAALAEKYGVHGIPTLMLVDREGKVVAVSHNVAEFKSKLEKLLAAK